MIHSFGFFFIIAIVSLNVEYVLTDIIKVLDLSEQEALECGYDPPEVNGCDGALPDSYITWIINRGGYMSDELNLQYNSAKLTHECPSDILVDDEPGVKITGEISAYDVDEEAIKKLVYNTGAVQTSIAASDDSFKQYSGRKEYRLSHNLVYHSSFEQSWFIGLKS